MADYAGANDFTSLNANFKQTYADNIKNLIPSGIKATKMIPFMEKSRQPGNKFNQPVVLGMEHGVTFADDTEGAFSLNPPVAGKLVNASIRGYQLVLRSVLSYSAASRAVGGDSKAFVESTKFLVGNMLDSVSKKLEIEVMYGQMGYGVVDSTPSTTTIVVEAAEFATGIWSGAEGMGIDIYDSTLTTLQDAVTVTAVDPDTRTLTVTPALVNTVAGDVIFHKGAKGKEFAGIHKILTNTGTLFDIDASQYNLWKGSSFAPSSTSVLSFAILQQAISKGVAKGLDSDVTVLVNPGHWDDLLTEQAALRMLDSSYKEDEVKNGSRSIKFQGQAGMIEIVPSIYVKEGYAYVLAKEDWVRVGSTDVTFKRPAQNDNFFRDLEDHAGYELRCYTDQALFCAKPGRSIIISNLKIA